MHIFMLDTRRLSETGWDVKPCEKGKVYDLADNAARYALNNGWARPATDEEVADLALAVLRSFRPQPTRGTGPTNPATLKAKGEDV